MARDGELEQAGRNDDLSPGAGDQAAGLVPCGVEAAMAKAGVTREDLGREVRRVWLGWAATQPDPKPSWLAEWDQLSPADQEVDMRIGQVLFWIGWQAEWHDG
jgi:hypothetical protein